MERVSGKCFHGVALVGRRWLVRGALELQFKRPPDFHFIPGQFVRFMMDGYQRDYTLINAKDSRTLDICVALVEGGRFTRDVMGLDMGDCLTVSGPHGHFIYQSGGYPSVFVATGSGVAPFVAFCRSGVSDALLLHGASTPDRLLYTGLLGKSVRTYIPCISRLPAVGHHPAAAYLGRVTRYLGRRLADATYDFYLCGRRDMIREATALIDQRFGSSRLFVENFG